MSLLICGDCGCVESTEFARLFRVRDGSRTNFIPDDLTEVKALCSQCLPEGFYINRDVRGGVWHGQFPQRIIATPQTFRRAQRQVRDNDGIGFIHFGAFEYMRTKLEKRKAS